MAGTISEYTSRRVNYDECKYWKRDNTSKDLEEYVYENEFTGIFYARETNSLYKEKDIVGDMFMFDRNTITIETDDIVDIDSNDIVLYDDDYWCVVNVQEKIKHKSSQFLKKTFHKTYIQLRK